MNVDTYKNLLTEVCAGNNAVIITQLNNKSGENRTSKHIYDWCRR